jgi:hypothetical protein
MVVNMGDYVVVLVAMKLMLLNEDPCELHI